MASIKASEQKYYVYVLCRPDGSPFYVGKGHGVRVMVHEKETRCGRRGHRFSIIRGIWKSGGAVSYRVAGHYADEEEAFAAEIALIASIRRRAHGGPLVNLTDGGEGPSGFTQEVTPATRAKLSAALTGKKKSPEHVAKVAAKRRGCRHSDEARKKMSEAVNKPEAVAKIRAARAGFRQSDAAREKIRQRKLGLAHSAETRAKMSRSHLGRVFSDETKAKLKARALARPPMGEETKAKIRATLLRRRST